jgi:hypothetical protein
MMDGHIRCESKYFDSRQQRYAEAGPLDCCTTVVEHHFYRTAPAPTVNLSLATSVQRNKGQAPGDPDVEIYRN